MGEKFARILSHLSVRKLIDCPMQEFTSLRVGGPADAILFPSNETELRELIVFAKSEGLPLYPLGGGTNLLVKDNGIRGAMISLSRGFNYINIEDHDNDKKIKKLRVGAGTSMGKICLYAMKNGLEGSESFLGIPGAVGGCLTMNAGTKKPFISGVVEKVVMMTEEGEKVTVERDEIEFGYRRAVFPVKGIIIEGLFTFKQGEKLEVREKMLKAAHRRGVLKRVLPFNAGSIFKSPPGFHAGALIEKCRLKGLIQGDAMISPLHGNIIVNRGMARAGDVLELIEIAKERVFENFGIELEEEVRIIGE